MRLIELWKEKPFLYDMTHKLHHHKGKKDAAIEEIAEALNTNRELNNSENIK